MAQARPVLGRHQLVCACDRSLCGPMVRVSQPRKWRFREPVSGLVGGVSARVPLATALGHADGQLGETRGLVPKAAC